MAQGTAGRFSKLVVILGTNVALSQGPVDSVFRQPFQSFPTGLKNVKVATGEGSQALRQPLKKVLRSRPCGFLDIELVKDSSFFHDPNTFLVNGCAAEIGKY